MPRQNLSRQDVVRAATQMADADGIDAVTLSAVARRLDIQPPSLYSHVRNLAELRDAVTESALARLAERIALATAGASGLDALRGLADAHRDLAHTSPGQWQALQRRAGRTAVESGAARQVVALNGAVLSGYGLEAELLVHAVRLVGSTINGFIQLESAGSFDHSAPAPAQSWDRAVEALHAVLTAWARDTSSASTPGDSASTSFS